MTNEVKEFMSQIEKFIKGGRLVFELLTKDEANEMTPRQLCVDYDYENKVARLYTMNDNNEIVPIKSKAEDIIEEFIIKFIEVSKNKKYDYNPSLHFKILREGEGFTQAHIEEFYNYMNDNFNDMKPYIQYVKDYQEVNHALSPFVTTDAVFIDLGKIIQDKGITNVTTAIKEFHLFVTNFESTMKSLIDSMNGSLSDLINGIKEDIDSIKNKYGEMDPLIKNLSSKINSLDQKISNISDNYLKKYESKTLNITNSGNRRINITSSGKSGSLILGSSVKANPSSPIIVMLENSRGSKWIIELFQNGYVNNMVNRLDPITVKVVSNGGSNLLNNVEPITNGYSISVNGPINVTVLSRANDANVAESGSGSSDSRYVNLISSTGTYTFSSSTVITKKISYGDMEFKIL